MDGAGRRRLISRASHGRVSLESVVWWQDFLWGFWNGLTAWIVLVVHVLGGWSGFPLFNVARNGNWYDFGFLLGAGSPLLGAVGARGRRGGTAKRT
jgi:hypothetical protein